MKTFVLSALAAAISAYDPCNDGADLGDWSGAWYNDGDDTEHPLSFNFCILENYLGGQGEDEGRDFNIVAGYLGEDKLSADFWQKFPDNGDNFRLVCEIQSDGETCVGTWYDYVLHESGSWYVSKDGYQAEDEEQPVESW